MIEPNKDGFVSISSPEDATVILNLERFCNEFSPFSNVDQIKSDLCNPLIVDSYYGQVYTLWNSDPDAIYGRTSELPEYAGDSFANYGFLRVPFRRIPRRLIHSRQELEYIVGSITSADDDIRMLFRGQNREYQLNRSSEALNILYGDSKAIEPSLMPSASRRGIALEDVLPEWGCLLQLFMHYQRMRIATWAPKATLDSIAESQQTLLWTYNFRLFALALAQHYGLPSAGLDVTDRLDVALFFALTEFTQESEENRIDLCKRKRSGGEPAVIYLLAPHSRFQLDYDEFRPEGFQSARPYAQSARFMHTGWGLNKNSCARMLFLALYLDPLGDFGYIPSVSELFPGPEDDPFGCFLEEVVQKPLSGSIGRFLRDFRWVLQG